MTTSIITSLYNSKVETLDVIDKLFFPSLLNNKGADKELIIIDDGSPLKKETTYLVEKYLQDLRRSFVDVKFIRNETNLGFSKSFNKGIFMASGEKLLVTNDDTYFPFCSIEKLVSTLSEKPGYGLVGPITNAQTAWSPQYCKQAPLIKSYSYTELERLELFSKWLAEHMKDRRMITDNLCGFCFAADAYFLKNIGGFNEKYKFGYYEDTDLASRVAREYGKEKLVINMEVFVGHGGIKGTSGSFLQHPVKMIYYLLVNGIKYANDWGYGKLLKRITYGILSQRGKGTISELLPDKIKF